MGRKVGLELAVDTKNARRDVKALTASTKRLGRQTSRIAEQGALATMMGKGMGKLNKHLGESEKRLKKVSSQYKAARREAKKYRDEVKALQKEGKKASKELQNNLKNAESRESALASSYRGGMQQVGAAKKQKKRLRKGRRMAMLGLAGAAAVGAWRWSKGMADQGLSTLIDNQMSGMQSRQLMGTDTSKQWSKSRRALERYGNSLAYTNKETHQFLQQTARATGLTGYKQGRANMQVARGFSVDSNILTSYQRNLRHAGGNMRQGTGEINRSLVGAMRSGGFARPLFGELITSIDSLTDQMGDARENMNNKTIPGLMAFLGSRLGGAYQQSPQRTGKLIGGLHGAISGTSGNDAAMALKLRAAGFGSGKSLVQSLMTIEQGFTNPEYVKSLIQQIKREYGGGEMGALALHRLTGGRVSLHASSRLMGMDLRGMDSRQITGMASGRGVNLGKEAAKSRKGTGLVRRQIGRQNTQAALRAKADFAYDEANKLQIRAMTLLISVMKRVDSFFKGYGGYMTGDKKLPGSDALKQYAPFFMRFLPGIGGLAPMIGGGAPKNKAHEKKRSQGRAK